MWPKGQIIEDATNMRMRSLPEDGALDIYVGMRKLKAPIQPRAKGALVPLTKGASGASEKLARICRRPIKPGPALRTVWRSFLSAREKTLSKSAEQPWQASPKTADIAAPASRDAGTP